MNTLRGYGHLTIGGAVRPFHVGTNQSAILCDLRGQDLADYNDMFASLLPSLAEDGTVVPAKRRHLSPSENRDFLYSSLAAGAQNDRQVVDFTPEQVGNWLDDEATDANEAAKPLVMHLELMKRRLEQQMARLGNAPAPQLTSSPGGTKKAASKSRK